MATMLAPAVPQQSGKEKAVLVGEVTFRAHRNINTRALRTQLASYVSGEKLDRACGRQAIEFTVGAWNHEKRAELMRRLRTFGRIEIMTQHVRLATA